MADIEVWNGSSSFQSGQTPFGFYDSDPAFQQDADKVASFCATRLGYPMMDVELQSGSFYACFEDAVTTYGNEVFQFKIRENYISMEGSQTGSDPFNDKLIEPTLDRVMGISQNYGTEAVVDGNVKMYTGKIDVKSGVQEYDMDKWAQDNAIQGGIEIRKVFYQSPPAILRYFDPYAGTGTGIQSLMDAFDFGSYSPGVNFLLMPASFDILKVQAIEFNDQIRKSGYSFELIDNQLKILPVPKQDGKMVFHYYKVDDKKAALTTDGKNLITNVGEVPYENPTYKQINSVGKHWIYKYTLALAKEMLAYVRGKYDTIPVPDSETTLNQSTLVEDSRKERSDLLEQLREMLEQTSRKEQLNRKSEESEALQGTLKNVPYTIYIG